MALSTPQVVDLTGEVLLFGRRKPGLSDGTLEAEFRQLDGEVTEACFDLWVWCGNYRSKVFLFRNHEEHLFEGESPSEALRRITCLIAKEMPVRIWRRKTTRWKCEAFPPFDPTVGLSRELPGTKSASKALRLLGLRAGETSGERVWNSYRDAMARMRPEDGSLDLRILDLAWARDFTLYHMTEAAGAVLH